MQALPDGDDSDHEEEPIKIGGGGFAGTPRAMAFAGKFAKRGRLMTAARSGAAKVLEEILSTDKTHVNWQDGKGWSCLMHACKQGHSKACKVLLKYGADPNMKNNGGNSSLMVAATRGSTDVIKQLLSAGVEVQSTALLIAEERGHARVVKLLESALKEQNQDTRISQRMGEGEPQRRHVSSK